MNSLDKIKLNGQSRLKAIKEYWLKEENTDLDKLLEEYIQFCKSFGLEVSDNYNEAEFEQVIKNI